MAKDAILGFLQADDGITDSHEFTAVDGVDHSELENVIKGLNGFEDSYRKFKKDNYLFSEEGKLSAVKGSPEVNFFLAVPPRGFPWKLLRQDWIPRFSVMGHHGLKRMIELRLPRDLFLESYHEGLKKWVEVGNSGMFTPEMVLPMHGVSLESCVSDETKQVAERKRGHSKTVLLS